MKKFIVFLLLLLCLGGGYYAYHYWFKDLNLSAWSLVPGDSFLVFEIDNLSTTLDELDSVETWQALNSIPAINKVRKDLHALDSLAGSNQEFERLFIDNPLLITLNVVAKDAFDLVYFFEVKNIQQHSTITRITDAFGKKYNKTTRKYLDYTITEIKTDTRLFTYIYYKNFFVGSFTPFLVEDVIRTLDDESVLSFQQVHKDLFDLVKMEQDQGNIYINSEKLDRVFHVFADDVLIDLSSLENITNRTFLDLRLQDNAIVMNGFSLNEEGNKLLNQFDGNPGTPFGLLDYIPENTAYVYHLSFQNPSAWIENWSSAYVNPNTAYENGKKQLVDQYDLNIVSNYDWLGNEIALVVAEAIQPDEVNRLLVVDASDIGEAYNQFNQIAERMAKVDRDSLFTEPYREYEIRQIAIDRFPELLFGSMAKGFVSTYYLPLDGRMVMANNLQYLKEMLDDLAEENNWGKSIKVNQFVDQLNQEANVNLIVDTNRSWKTLTAYSRNEWQSFFEKNAPLLRSFEHLAVQFSNIDDKYYTNILLSQPEGFDQSQSPGNIEVEKTVSFPHRLVASPQFSRSHIDRSLELSVQDSVGNFYHLNNDLEVLWSDSLSQQMNSDLFQIDYYKNKKLQFLFSTPDRIYGLDRTGKALPAYPLTMRSKGGIDFFNVIDYNKTRDYRLIAANTSGDLYLMDKSGTPLGIWKPLALGGELAIKPFHLRINSRDLIIAPLENGVIHVRNRRGNNYQGFPLDLKERLAQGIFIRTGSNLAQTRLTMVTQTGSIIEFNLEGAIFKREQLLKPEVNSKFKLINDALDNDFVILRRDDTRIGILDQNGNVLFEKDYLSTGTIKCQYYNFGAGNEVIVIIDSEQEFAYLYNRQGKLINFKPLETGQEIGLLYSESKGQFEIYKVFENELSRLTIQR